MPVPILSDGTPLTFEWLNSVANAINALEVDNKNNSNILVSGIKDAGDIQIVTGTQDINLGADQKGVQIRRKDIYFPVAFADAAVTVVAMVTHDVGGNTKPNPAAISVDGITDKKFNATIQVFDADNNIKKEKFKVRYIAIGKRAVS